MTENEPIRRRKLSHEILERLLARVTSGELAAGEHLPSERDLMAQYQVGRPCGTGGDAGPGRSGWG